MMTEIDLDGQRILVEKHFSTHAQAIFSSWLETACSHYPISLSATDIRSQVLKDCTENFFIVLSECGQPLSHLDYRSSVCANLAVRLNQQWLDRYVLPSSAAFNEALCIHSVKDSFTKNPGNFDELYEVYAFIQAELEELEELENDAVDNGDDQTVSSGKNFVNVVPITVHKNSLNVKKHSFKREFLTQVDRDLHEKFAEIWQIRSCMCCPDLGPFIPLSLLNQVILSEESHLFTP